MNSEHDDRMREEVEAGRSHAIGLCELLYRMGATSMEIPVEIDGVRFLVKVELDAHVMEPPSMN